eukprot:3789773-Heterocapsa_arctica.AAC.1
MELPLPSSWTADALTLNCVRPVSSTICSGCAGWSGSSGGRLQGEEVARCSRLSARVGGRRRWRCGPQARRQTWSCSCSSPPSAHS